jgi:hypothetical protein
MSGDYKYEMQLLAEEIAKERYGKELYDLTYDKQYECFNSAMNKWTERMCDMADHLRKATRENGK